jgi:hypothetical protein
MKSVVMRARIRAFFIDATFAFLLYSQSVIGVLRSIDGGWRAVSNPLFFRDCGKQGT